MTNEPPGYVEVFQHRTWFGDPTLAVFSVYVDKKRAGKVPLQSKNHAPSHTRSASPPDPSLVLRQQTG